MKRKIVLFAYRSLQYFWLAVSFLSVGFLTMATAQAAMPFF